MTLEIKKNVSLETLNTFKIAGKAKYFAEINSVDHLKEALDFAEKNKLSIFILGGGSNVLISDKSFDGLVLKINIKGVSWRDEGDTFLVTAGAGEIWDDLVAQSVKRNLYGLQNLSGIPGSVGGAPVQNIGAYGAEIKEVLHSVEIFDKEKKVFLSLSKEDCKFGYRDSIFKTPEGINYIITKVTLLLKKTGDLNLNYKDVALYFATHEKTPTLAMVREAILEIRNKKFPDLSKVGTAGSFFKNPIVSKEKYEELLKKYPNMPSYVLPNSQVKIPLAWIIDKVCGLKGKRDDNVGTFENQAIVLINWNGATGVEIKNFAEKIKKEVKEKTGIEVEMEVQEMK